MQAEVFLLFFLVAFWTSDVAGQSTNATCLPFYDWMRNSKKQTPCQVASSLLAVCTGSYDVAALPGQSYYLGPSLSSANPCQCNTVVYSLMSACGACQDRTHASWTQWSANCAAVSNKFFPEEVPQAILIPGWAYLDVVSNDSFDEIAAKSGVNVTESTVHNSTKTSSALATTVWASTTSTPSATRNPEQSGVNLSHVNAIGGGITGGIVGLGLIVAFATWYFYRRSRSSSPATEKSDMQLYSSDQAITHQRASSLLTSLPLATTGCSSSTISGSTKSLGHSAV